jgi:hypothetical protein
MIQSPSYSDKVPVWLASSPAFPFLLSRVAIHFALQRNDDKTSTVDRPVQLCYFHVEELVENGIRKLQRRKPFAKCKAYVSVSTGQLFKDPLVVLSSLLPTTIKEENGECTFLRYIEIVRGLALTICFWNTTNTYMQPPHLLQYSYPPP